MRDDERDEKVIWTKHQEKTFDKPPHDILLQALKYFDGFTGYAIDLGCGAGMDTIELLQRGWEVLAIDNNPYSFDKIKSKLEEKQLTKLKMQEENFENLVLPKTDFINASFSIPFCNPRIF